MQSVNDAMSLFGLEHRRCFHNVNAQVKVLVAWSGELVVLAARGTAEAANFLHDVKVCANDCLPVAFALKRGKI